MARKLHMHPIGLAFVIFGVLSWVVALGGLAASTKYCYDSDGGYSCSDMYQLEWWSVWFEFIILVAILATAFLNAFQRARYIYLTYLVMATFLLTLTANTFITDSFNSGGHSVDDYKGDAYNAAAAGAVLLCMTNFCLIIFIGLSATMDVDALALPNIPGMNRFAPSPAAQGYSSATF